MGATKGREYPTISWFQAFLSPTESGPVAPILPTSQPVDGSRRGKLLVLSDSFFEGIQPYFEYEFAVVKIRRTGRSAQEDLITQGLLDAGEARCAPA